MKKFVIFGLIAVSMQAYAFDFKGLVKKVSEDKKTQEQIKDAAKKGYEYFQGDKKEESKTVEAKKK
jgi:hypothetical protein